MDWGNESILFKGFYSINEVIYDILIINIIIFEGIL